MKRTVLAILLIFGVAGVASAQVTTVVGSAHDFSGVTNTAQVCVFCHTPHQATAANTQDPLWNHTLQSTVSYGVYASGTMDHNNANSGLADIGGQTAGTASVSFLCMSCHDGTVAVSSLWNDPNDDDPVTLLGGAGWDLDADGNIDNTHSAYVGTSLADDHPVNFTYDDTLDSELKAAPGNNVLRSGQVECSSCHDPHKSVDTYGFFRVTMTGSALCITCHDK
jgi:predicted CXXCH cytochrome family protein